MSLSRSESARINGAKSRGPKTPEGKAVSSQNAIRHGHFAKTILLKFESPEGFQELTDEFMTRYQPRDGVEHALVEQIIAATWRHARCLSLQTETMNYVMQKDLGHDYENVTARSFQSLIAGSSALQLLHRFEQSYERTIIRATRSLLSLRKNFPLPDDQEPPNCENERAPQRRRPPVGASPTPGVIGMTG